MNEQTYYFLTLNTYPGGSKYRLCKCKIPPAPPERIGPEKNWASWYFLNNINSTSCLITCFHEDHYIEEIKDLTMEEAPTELFPV